MTTETGREFARATSRGNDHNRMVSHHEPLLMCLTIRVFAQVSHHTCLRKFGSMSMERANKIKAINDAEQLLGNIGPRKTRVTLFCSMLQAEIEACYQTVLRGARK